MIGKKAYLRKILGVGTKSPIDVKRSGEDRGETNGTAGDRERLRAGEGG